MDLVLSAVLFRITPFLGRKCHQCCACANALRRSSRLILECDANVQFRPWPPCCPWEYVFAHSSLSRSDAIPIMIFWQWEGVPFMMAPIAITQHTLGINWERRVLEDAQDRVRTALGLSLEPAMLALLRLPSVARAAARALEGDVKISLHFAGELFALAHFRPSSIWPSLRTAIMQETLRPHQSVCRICLTSRGDLSECRQCGLNALCAACRMPRDSSCVSCVDNFAPGAYACRLRIRKYWFHV